MTLRSSERLGAERIHLDKTSVFTTCAPLCLNLQVFVTLPLFLSMKRQVNIAKWQLARTLLLIGVLASLCFSVGEGLRLLPFSGPSLDDRDLPNIRANVSTPRVPSVANSGARRMEMPAPAHNRIKRQLAHWSIPLSPPKPELSTKVHRCLHAGEPLCCHSLVSISQPAGRAPPPIA